MIGCTASATQQSMTSLQQMQHTCLPFAGRHLRKHASLAARKFKHACNASQHLPSIREFIQNECPVKGMDGTFREQAKPASLTNSVIAVDSAALVVPGERRLFDVPDEQLNRIIEDQGQVLICCFEASREGLAVRKLAAPKRGSWSCLGRVAGLQRLPASGRARVRVLVKDRVAIQAVDSNNPSIVKAQSALLRDRWAYFVRTAAVEQCLAAGAGSEAVGSEVTGAVDQVQDAAAELMQLMHQLANTVQAVIDSPTVGQLQQLLIAKEAGDELHDILAWCNLESPTDMQKHSVDGSISNSSIQATGSGMPADAALLEKAWRLSFAPYAAKGLAAALFSGTSRHLQSTSEDVREALEMTDLGLRLEAALDVVQLLRSNLAAQLALKQM